jgi:hypothetical protein
MSIKVWGILEGPVDIKEVDEEDNLPEDAGWFMVCKTEIDGQIQPVNFWFETMDHAYEWQKHFSKSIEPLIVEDKYKDHMT